MVLAAVNDWTLRLIILNTKLSGGKTYTSFVSRTYGTFGRVVVLLAQGFFAFGGRIKGKIGRIRNWTSNNKR